MKQETSMEIPAAHPDERVIGQGALQTAFWPAWLPRRDDPNARLFWTIAAVIMLAGALLRLVGMLDDFWLDEIWSWSFARSAQSVSQIFFGLHHDNNHYLNTLWIHLCGDQPHWWIYRLHSYLAGLLTIVGGGLLAGSVTYDTAFLSKSTLSTKSATRFREPHRTKTDSETSPAVRARTTALIAMLLFATCEMNVVYSTEARGYSLAAMAAVLSTILLGSVVQPSIDNRDRRIVAILYAVMSIIGFLSHLLFATVFVPQAIWGTIQLVRRRSFLLVVGCFAPAVIAVGILWYYDLRLARVGGGPEAVLVQVALEALALPLGKVSPDWLVITCAMLALIGLIQGLIFLWKSNLADMWLFALVLLLVPPLIIGVRSTELLTPRHFYIGWMVLLPLLSFAIVRWTENRSSRKIVIPLLFAIWIGTNGSEYVEFARYGRGGYQQAVSWLIEQTEMIVGQSGRTLTVGSDHDFRNGLVLSFYARQMPNHEVLTYVPQGRWPAEGVDWMIVHDLDRDFRPAKEIDVGPWHYVLARFEPYSAPIGFHWAIYQRQASLPSQ